MLAAACTVHAAIVHVMRMHTHAHQLPRSSVVHADALVRGTSEHRRAILRKRHGAAGEATRMRIRCECQGVGQHALPTPTSTSIVSICPAPLAASFFAA